MENKFKSKRTNREFSSKMKLKLIVACDSCGNIGADNEIPWPPLKNDLRSFKNNTTAGVNPGILMGRKTWESLKNKAPLPNRINMVLTRDRTYVANGAIVVHDVIGVLINTLRKNIDNLWVIGGHEIYKLFLPHVDEILITKIDHIFDNCDVKFPEVNMDLFFHLIERKKFEEKNYTYFIERWLRNSINI